MVKDSVGPTLQELLRAELDEEFGYNKYDYRNKDTDNSRNGYSKKMLKTSSGELEINIPRDRLIHTAKALFLQPLVSIYKRSPC